jgi:DNA-binding transcriptional MerR regulator
VGRTWRIGEVADRTGLTRRTLRHYDELGLLIPAGRSGGDYRLYDEDDLLRLLQIQNLKALGLSLPEIADALADPDLDATTTLRSHLVQLEESIAAQRGLAARLQNLAANTDRSWEDVLAAIAMTQALAHPDPIVRIRAALQPSAMSTRDLVDALTAETDPAVREVLMWSLAQQPDAAEAALALLDDPDPELRCLFVRLLAKLRAPAAAPALVPLLADPVPRVVSTTIQALGQLRDPSTVPPLVALLAAEPVPSPVLIETLSGFGEAALDALTAALDSPAVGTRLAVAEIVGRIGGESPAALGSRCAELVDPLIDDPDPQLRLTAVLALGEIGSAGRAGIERALAAPELAGVARRLLLDLHAT